MIVVFSCGYFVFIVSFSDLLSFVYVCAFVDKLLISLSFRGINQLLVAHLSRRSSFFLSFVCSARFSLSNEPTSPKAYFTKKADPDLQRYLPVRFRKGAFVIADASAIRSLSLKGTNRTRAAIDHYFYHTLCANSFVNINPVFFCLAAHRETNYKTDLKR